jgi:hypothetical protein
MFLEAHDGTSLAETEFNVYQPEFDQRSAYLTPRIRTDSVNTIPCAAAISDK